MTNIFNLSKKNILVTGGAGFLGSHLVRRLVELGGEITIIDHPDSNLWRIEKVLHKVNYVSVDIGSVHLDTLISSVGKQDVIYHLAAAGVNQTYNNSNIILQTNIIGTQKILQFALKTAVDKFVYCGSCFEYGSGEKLSENSLLEPLSEYAVSKTAGWYLTNAYHKRYDLPVISLRPFTPYGPFEASYRFMPQVILKALSDLPINLTLGEQTRDFVFIDDLVDAFLLAVVHFQIGETFNICSGNPTRINEAVTRILSLSHSSAEPRFGAIPYRDSEVWTMSGNPEKAKQILYWEAKTSLHEGLSKTIQWFQEFQSQYLEYKSR